MFNPKTKREVIRRTHKVLGHEPQPLTQPEYEMTQDGDVTVTSVSIDNTSVSEDIDDYQYLVGRYTTTPTTWICTRPILC